MAAKKAAGGSLETALDALKERATQTTLDGMARYAIPSERAWGVAMRDLQAVAKSLGKNHALAAELWASRWYEARLLACYVDDPAAVTAKQMDDWCQDFDNWAIVDTVCFALFKRSPHAWPKVEAWASRTDEFQRRGAFALIWALAGGDGDDKPFLRGLELIEQAATDERNFVKKSVNMALRATGRRSLSLHKAAVAVAKRLAVLDNPAAWWIGKDAQKGLESPKVVQKLR